MRKTILVFSILTLYAAVFAAASCCHDNILMRRNNESMRQSIAEMKQEQARQRSEIRQIKTDTETALRIITTGEYIEVADNGL
ncbi:MAG: hypothetical protein MJZ72_09890 [Bacteroidales bacterium]|nr:hypothetical protein [Bacteroidales bacterium]